MSPSDQLEGAPLIKPSSTDHPLHEQVVEACRPVAGEMPGWVAEAIEPLAGVKHVDVELTWEPPWGMDMMSDEARLELGFM